ncbi:VOC family protein [Phytoactinopolyspora mesophila]|uniref:VOC family protein n=1 Tax=Phytoactinopolyspora mesophila TaxID=2650750 RepID=UPI0013917174
MIQKIGVISVPVHDQQRAKEFFTGVLGFAEVRDEPYTSEARWIELAPEGAETAITLVTWFPAMPPGGLAGMVLKSDDVTRVHKSVAESAASDVTDPVSAPWGTSFTFTDTEGNGWIVQQD